MREELIRYLTGARPWPANDTNRWGLFRNPLPPAGEHAVFRDMRNDAGLTAGKLSGRDTILSARPPGGLPRGFPTLAERHNPIVRRVVRRTRPMLEERGLLKRDRRHHTSARRRRPARVAVQRRRARNEPRLQDRLRGGGVVQSALCAASTRRRISEDNPAAAHRVLRARPASKPPGVCSADWMSLSCRRRRSATKARPTISRRPIPKKSHFCARSNAIWRPSWRARISTPRCKSSCTICASGSGWRLMARSSSAST